MKRTIIFGIMCSNSMCPLSVSCVRHPNYGTKPKLIQEWFVGRYDRKRGTCVDYIRGEQ